MNLNAVVKSKLVSLSPAICLRFIHYSMCLGTTLTSQYLNRAAGGTGLNHEEITTNCPQPAVSEIIHEIDLHWPILSYDILCFEIYSL